jgi:NAD(P)-dependent dehydrogenase (short-subunit alcohol dehydrogenase family)
MNLVGKTALITGGAHRVGRAIALELAERKVNLVIHYNHSRDAAEQTATQLRDMGVEVVTHQADLRQYDDIFSMFRALDEADVGLDLLVNSAAILDSVPLPSVTEADWHRTIDLNLKAPFFCIQQAAQRMRQRDGGSIVNISDIIGIRPSKRFPIHSISKAGIETLTRVAALALAPEIRVNAVAPGPVMKPSKMVQERWDQLARTLPLGRAGTALDVARAVVFLFENDYITGETLVVDGGMRGSYT